MVAFMSLTKILGERLSINLVYAAKIHKRALFKLCYNKKGALLNRAPFVCIYFVLFYSNRFCQVAGLINIAITHNSNVVSQQL